MNMRTPSTRTYPDASAHRRVVEFGLGLEAPAFQYATRRMGLAHDMKAPVRERASRRLAHGVRDVRCVEQPDVLHAPKPSFELGNGRCVVLPVHGVDALDYG